MGREQSGLKEGRDTVTQETMNAENVLFCLIWFIKLPMTHYTSMINTIFT